ncbi:hypothetical protein NC652_038551 [Populus alba x Populus x berolinensis]|nr:hypothetical protein NC652_038551 [Populus alba x Populus x berolinensis]
MSAFIRSEWPSIDIPLDNEVFAVPKDHNAPQQICGEIAYGHMDLLDYLVCSAQL